MGAGAALMEELAVDKRFGFFVNHDLAGYEVPVHADIPHQEVIFLDEVDPLSSPMKARGIGELGLCGVAAAIANAVYNATGVRVRDCPVTLDKHLDRLPALPEGEKFIVAQGAVSLSELVSPRGGSALDLRPIRLAISTVMPPKLPLGCFPEWPAPAGSRHSNPQPRPVLSEQ